MSGLRINTNIPALNAARILSNTTDRVNKSVERLASGLRINRAGDDAAGLAISEGMKRQINGLNQATRNAQEGVSLLQVADSGLAQISEMLARLSSLAVQASNGTLTTSDRAIIQVEVTALINEIGRQASATTFNSKVLLTGSFASGKGSIVFQVGASEGDKFSINIATTSTSALGIRNLMPSGVTTQLRAESAITLIQAAITEVAGNRAQLGAFQNRLDSAISFASLQSQYISNARSNIVDADFAVEIVELTKNQILQQTGISALSQANIGPQNVLSLLPQ